MKMQNGFKRVVSLLICLALLVSYLPISATRTSAATGDIISVIADPQTLTRPGLIYGDSTVNAGKITVGKSVSTTDIEVNGHKVSLDGLNNFLVTISQSAQTMGMTSESTLPVDVVFVLDTSGSMWAATDLRGPKADGTVGTMNRSEAMIQVINNTIQELMALNSENRVGVVAFSGHNQGENKDIIGDATNDAAIQLSPLASYSGEAASNHLTYGSCYVGWTNGNQYSVHGRDAQGNVGTAERYYIGGATNIQAGIAKGAEMLANAALSNGNERIPFLIVLSDGAPTVSSSNDAWWEPDSQQSQGNYTYMDDGDPVEGNSFLTLLTAAFAKKKVSDHYTKYTGKQNDLTIYTVGYGLDTQNTDYEVQMSKMTLNPLEHLLATSGNIYQADISAAWSKYVAHESFSIQVGPPSGTLPNGYTHDGLYYFYDADTTVTYNRRQQLSLVNRQPNDIKDNETWIDAGSSVTYRDNIIDDIIPADGSLTALAYNDEYYEAANASGLQQAFADMLVNISKKAVSSPTKVTTGDHNFDGYVTFYDPIGEYMEVKDMKGILANGFFYQGQTFAEKLKNYGTSSGDAEFDALLRKTLKTRMGLSSADDRFASEAEVDAFIDDLLIRARNSENQAQYIDKEHYDNSIVWWGNAYDSGEEDEHVQMIGFADNDTIEYITAEDTVIPEGADYVCRSYFFYGTAGGADTNSEHHELMYFMVRVQRELVAPYRETVVISAPASLLSVEEVLISETFDENGDPVYTATVQHSEPARVVYEVGLWDTITAENVSFLVSQEYAQEAVAGKGAVNYDPVTETYHFFTNDWDRGETLESHHRAMAKATFDAADDNAFYTYQQDTLIVDANGNPVTADPSGTTAYYVREYYAWTADHDVDGDYAATRQSILIQIQIPADAQLVEKDGKWYLPKGAYTGATLVVNGDDTLKDDPTTPAVADGNFTETSSIVAHPHRTGDASNSHYTVLLGNNGRLSLKSEPYAPQKTASVNLPAGSTTIVDDEGKPVQVGDVLTYTVEVKNILPHAADITVTDYIPQGTAFVEGSAGSGTSQTGHTQDASIQPDSNNLLHWTLKDVPSGQTRYISFQVRVTDAALGLNVVSNTITNTAQVTIGNTAYVKTNTTSNPPYGKSVTDTNGADLDGAHGFKVGDILVYHIRLYNNATNANGDYVAADVTVTDQIPAGTTFLSADNGGSYDASTGVVTWKFEDMAANTAKVVSFRVQINATVASGLDSAAAEVYLPNTATIRVENAPQVTTNTTQNWADVGDMVITKLVAAGGDTAKTFTLHLRETTGMLNGTYGLDRDGNEETVTFVSGEATVTIQHGQTLTIQKLPAGVIIHVEEDLSALPGWTPTYNTQTVTIVKGAATAVSSVSVTNTYTLQPLTVTVNGVKNMTGNELTAQTTFGFIAVPDSSNPVVGDPLTGEVTVQGPGSYSFSLSPKTFTQPGVYRYILSEVDGGVQGVAYDGTEYTLVINVTDNGDGTMSASATLDQIAFDLENDQVAFSNTYVPNETQLEISADKDLIGRDLYTGEFHFQLTDGTNVYKGVHDADGNILFETIVFTQEGTYTYTMSEVIPAVKEQGVSYDTKTYEVVVKVTDQGGQLVSAVTVDGVSVSVQQGVVDSGVTFVNRYTPDDIPLQLMASKTLMVYNTAEGKYEAVMPAAGQFRFQIVDKATGQMVSSGMNAADGTVTFETFYFSAEMLKDVTADASGNKTKTFTYVISEVVPELTKDPNMLYDLAAREITATLVCTSAGKLTVTVNGDSDGSVDLTGAANFINYGNPDSVSVRPSGLKTTKGENLPAGLSFSFQVLPVGGTADAAVGTSAATVGGTDSETVDITFTALVYTHENLGDADSKIYRYWIQESNATAGSNGVTYDTTRYLYQVVLSRDAYGRLVAEEQYFALKAGGNAENAADYTVDVTSAGIRFTNTYEAAAHINLSADKTLTGRNPGLAAGEFEFVLHRLDASGKRIPGSEITGFNDASGKIHFATLNYANTMLDEAYKHSDGAFYFSYLMSEIVPSDVAVPGVTYDPSEYVVTVKVTQTVQGLSAELAGVSKAAKNGSAYAPGEAVSGFTAEGDTNVTFVNTYQAVEGDELHFQIRKVLQGRPLRAGEFEFGLYWNGKLEDVATNDENGIITFSRTIPATVTTGTHKLVIRESKGSVAGVTYSQQEFVLYVKIEDNGTGKIAATLHLTENGPALEENAAGVVDLTKEIAFTNTYDPADTRYTPTAQKELTGRDQLAGEFSFQAQLISKDGVAIADGAVYSGVNNANGQVIFESISYTEAGTYLYRISERKGAIHGVKYDETVYFLKVVVSDNGEGSLQTAASYYTDEACTRAANSVTFHNRYVPADASVQLEANKVLIGRPMIDKEFSFVVRANDRNGKIVATGSNNAAGKILFSTFDITAADMAGAQEKVFTYVIVESNNSIPGVSVDPSVIPVTVTVTDDGTGALTAEVQYPDGKPVTFTNLYTPGSVELPLSAYKVLTGKNLLADAFTFELKDADGSLLQSVTNDANGVIGLQKLIFTAADLLDAEGNKVMEKTFRYTLSEKMGNVDTMEYDRTVYTILVTVTDDGLGNLSAAMRCEDGKGNAVELMQFHNSYTPPVLKAELEGNKTIVDADGNVLTDSKYPLNGFTFLVYDLDGKLITEAQSDQNGNILFTGFEFTEAGEYRFLISEKETLKPGYTTDPTVWCVHITVGYDADTGLLFEQSEYIHLAPENHEEIALQSSEELNFVNIYDPADVELTLKGLKQLDGRELNEHEFSFYMVDQATGLRAAESRNHGNGEINFHITYTKAGTYVYTVYEEIPAKEDQLGGVTYTTKTHQITVEVTDDGTGALKAKIGDITVLGKGTADLTGSVIFLNTYKPDSVTVELDAWKYLTGKKLENKEFIFELVNKKDQNEKYTATNNAEGYIDFESLTFDTAGEYVYTLREIQGDKTYITYDDEIYTVTITVTDDGKGQLHAAVSYTNSGDEQVMVPVFENAYIPEKVTYTPEVKKSYLGGEMLTFDFILSGYGFDTQIKQNDSEGNVTFDELHFTHADTYVFTISEKVNESLENIKWDTNVYTLQIHVTDDGKGKLAIASISITSELGRDDLVFRNVHEDLITKKEVFLAGQTDINIDGKNVEKGDVLTYRITYKNYTGKTVDVTITDTISQHTTYVDGSANLGGTLKDGVLTWNIQDVEPEAVVTVWFDVVVNGTDAVSNQATVLEGENIYQTNVVTNPVVEDEVVKDVFSEEAPAVSIDGQKVQLGDTLVYEITYTNHDDFGADVIITDKIPQYTIYVDGSADQGGTYDNGVVTWKVHLDAGKSVTVRFRVKVITANVHIVNQAVALEGQNEQKTNVVTNSVPKDEFVKDVHNAAKPEISIDGESVKLGDVLVYTITYTNSFDAAADVAITDKLSQYTTYVDGSADKGGVYADGVITWNVHLEAGQSVTVSFQAVVNAENVNVTNEATALEGTTELKTNAVTNPVPKDEVVKDVFSAADPTVSIDGKQVKVGDVLVYTITYTNSFDAAADVVLTDKLSQYTTYVDGSADKGGVYADGVITWNVHLEAGQSVTVSFQAVVNAENVNVINEAIALEGENEVTSNVVVNPVPKDEVVKDVFSAADPIVSIDGKQVKVGDVLVYTITYTNSFEAAADVTITDKIPQYTTYVDGSADKGGVYADGVITWNVHLDAGQSVTVSFRVTANTQNVKVTNQATALEGENELKTNVVVNLVEVSEVPKTADPSNLPMWLLMLVLSGGGICILLIQDRKRTVC